jgi:hypothetical protein
MCQIWDTDEPGTLLDPRHPWPVLILDRLPNRLPLTDWDRPRVPDLEKPNVHLR